MRLTFHTLDVFTEKRFGGNPLAVVLGADQLDSSRMQTIAREFNLSETVFVLKPINPAHSARIRIFTPVSEIPFAGHPTVGTAALLAQLRAPGLGANQDALVTIEETIGTVRIGVRMREGQATFAEFDAPKLPEDMGAVPSIDDLAMACGLLQSEIGFENHKPTRYSAGAGFTFVPVRSLEAMARTRAVLSRWERAFAGSVGAYLYCRETVSSTARFHVRMFAPTQGVLEDPATGAAAAALAGVIQRFDRLPSGEHRYGIEQGIEMGRPSLVLMSLVIANDTLDTVRIGGHSVRVIDGEIEV